MVVIAFAPNVIAAVFVVPILICPLVVPVPALIFTDPPVDDPADVLAP